MAEPHREQVHCIAGVSVGKWLMIAVMLLFAVGQTVLVAKLGSQRAWDIWNVQAGQRMFLDLHVMPAAAASWRAGYDPILLNPADPLHRPLNYPRLWYLLFLLPIKPYDVPLLGAVLIAGAAAAVLAMHRPLTLGQGFWTGVLLLTPGVLLGVERGNLDLLMLILLAAAVAAWNAGSFASSALVVMLAGLLKFYPFFAVAIYLRAGWRRYWLAALPLGLLMGLYVLGTRADVQDVLTRTGPEYWRQYGVKVTAWALQRVWPGLETGVAGTGVWALLLAVMAVSAGWGRRLGRGMAGDVGPHLTAFYAGAGVYLGSFPLTLNFNYRLCFFLLLVPQLVQWCSPMNRRLVRLTAAGALAACIATSLGVPSLYHIVGSYDGTLLVDEACNWLAFAGLAALTIASVPRSTADSPAVAATIPSP